MTFDKTDIDLIGRTRAVLKRTREIRESTGLAWYRIVDDAPEKDALLAALAERLQKAFAERSALIGQRIVEDGVGRGWWAYVDAPEDEQGFPEPFLFSTYADAERAVLECGEPTP